ncbi:MAG TPA: hypothetical protein EYH46_03085 [Sulfurivirga caldicuralii]|nr:hypothetical protein [Sulfurivirga caldicuralii]
MSTFRPLHSTDLCARVKQTLTRRAPRLAPLLWPLARRLLHLEDIDAFMARHSHLDAANFTAAVLDYFNTTYNAPACPVSDEGPVVIFANHPLGALDALALLHWVQQQRPDTRIVANHWLKAFTPLVPALIAVDNFTTRAGGHKRCWQQMNAHLQQGGVLLIFPAGEVSRLSLQGVRDRRWHSSFVRLARSHHAPLLPVRIHARNSPLFYAASLVDDALGTLLLPHQMYARRGQSIRLQPGKMIAPQTLPGDNACLWTAHLYQQLYRLP